MSVCTLEIKKIVCVKSIKWLVDSKLFVEVIMEIVVHRVPFLPIISFHDYVYFRIVIVDQSFNQHSCQFFIWLDVRCSWRIGDSKISSAVRINKPLQNKLLGLNTNLLIKNILLLFKFNFAEIYLLNNS